MVPPRSDFKVKPRVFPNSLHSYPSKPMPRLLKILFCSFCNGLIIVSLRRHKWATCLSTGLQDHCESNLALLTTSVYELCGLWCVGACVAVSRRKERLPLGLLGAQYNINNHSDIRREWYGEKPRQRHKIKRSKTITGSTSPGQKPGVILLRCQNHRCGKTANLIWI